MNIRIPKAFLVLAATLTFPTLSWGAENLSPDVANDEFFDAPPAITPAPAPNSSGVVFRDGAAYIVHKLQSELSLPDGTKVEPNGTITGFDGNSKLMPSGQMLSLDGVLKQDPFNTAPLIPDQSKTPQDFFAPASGTFPGRSDTLSFSTGEKPDSGDFSD